jgi:hypothetical protein
VRIYIYIRAYKLEILLFLWLIMCILYYNYKFINKQEREKDEKLILEFFFLLQECNNKLL